MQAWGNNPEVRQRALDALTTARERGMLYHGSYFSGPKENGCPTGCAVGTIYMGLTGESAMTALLNCKGSVVGGTAQLIDLPRWVVSLVETLYETEVWRDANKAYPERALRAVPVGLELPYEMPTEIVRTKRRYLDKSPISTRQFRKELIEAFESFVEKLLAEQADWEGNRKYCALGAVNKVAWGSAEHPPAYEGRDRALAARAALTEAAAGVNPVRVNNRRGHKATIEMFNKAIRLAKAEAGVPLDIPEATQPVRIQVKV